MRNKMNKTDKVYKVQEIVRDKLFGDYFLRVPKGLELDKWVLVNSNRLWEVDLEDIDVSFSEVDKKTLNSVDNQSPRLMTLVLDENGNITI
jgi:hypothetical protein|tara:strand:- start:95 stop:367 length:273 start_codon:yes stop_codon:yes gene_type:complete